GHIISLADADNLEDYIYLVAGCVGEWWTRICFQIYQKYSREPEEDLTVMASAFGKGLQLVNILRDMPADLRSGRCYLPEEKLVAAGLAPAELLQPTNEARLRPLL